MVDNKQVQEYFKDVPKPVVEKIIYEWQDDARPFKKRNRQYKTTIITIALLISLILFFAGQVLTVAVVIAVVFLVYVLSTIPPQTVTNQISSFGIRADDKLYLWQELGRFWFDVKYNQKVLLVEVGRFPYRLTLVVNKADQKLLTNLLSEVLVEQKPLLTTTEKWAEWLKKKVPLDLDS